MDIKVEIKRASADEIARLLRVAADSLEATQGSGDGVPLRLETPDGSLVGWVQVSNQ